MHALPPEFVNRILTQFPESATELLAALDKPPRASIRLNSAKPIAMSVAAQSVPWNNEGLLLETRPRYTLDPLLHAGCYYPQESSSMVLQWVLKHCIALSGHVDALDLCAAPGGKTLIVADFLKHRGRLIANELVRSRVRVLEEVVVKWGSANVIVTNGKPADFGEGAMQFDLMVIDAPCSGEGMFRKDVDSRAEWTKQSPELCSMRQREILENALPALKQNGILIYSTCTFAEVENEHILNHLVASGEFESISIPAPSEWNLDVLNTGGIHALRFLPHRVPGEGFFIAALRKKSAVSAYRPKPKALFAELSAKQSRPLEQVGLSPKNLLLGPDHELYRCVFSAAELNAIAANNYITMPGVHLGRLVREEFIPAHAAALGQEELWTPVPIELNDEQAAAYLRGETIALEAPQGWQRVAFAGWSLGWIKVMGTRINNYYPKEWRVKIKE